MEIFFGMLGGLGVGQLITRIIDHFLNSRISKKNQLYIEKRDTYLGLLDSLRKTALSSSEENVKEFAYWHARATLFGSSEVSNVIQEVINSNGPNDKEKRSYFYDQLLLLMKKDLGISSLAQ